MSFSQRENWMALILFMSSCAALTGAWILEHFFHMIPCALCLWERWPWRLLLILSLFVLVTVTEYKRYTLYLCTLPLLTTILLSVCHVGVEWGWWASPLPACHAPHLSGNDLMARWNEMPLKPERPCDTPIYPIASVPISLSMMNGLIAIFLLIVLFIFRKPQDLFTSPLSE